MNNNIDYKLLQLILLILLSVPLVLSCKSENKTTLPVKGEFPQVKLINYDGEDFYFKDIKGKVVVVSYIYTNCPDICHITSKKLNNLKSGLDQQTRNDLVFVSITFDPTRDTPNILREHIGMMDLNVDNWFFVTGRRDLVYETLNLAGINPVPDKMESNDSYTFNHRDRISLVDREGQIRKHYKGSTFDADELVQDLKTLL